MTKEDYEKIKECLFKKLVLEGKKEWASSLNKSILRCYEHISNNVNNSNQNTNNDT